MNQRADIPCSTPRNSILVWDLPVRIAHWIGVTCFVVLWFTREAHRIDLHAVAGYVLLGILTFRIVWGFVGTHHARFASFAYSPRAVFEYLHDAFRGRARHFAGHNPAGSWSVYFLLALGVAAIVSGMVALGGMFGLGPLTWQLGPEQSEIARATHEFLAWAMLVLVGAHISGVVWSSWVHVENLVGAMFTGMKPAWNPADGIASARLMAGACLLLVVMIGAAAYLAQSDWPGGYAQARASAKQSAKSTAPTVWSKECDSCHFPYPPDFLAPAANEAMLASQAEHFGEDLALDDRRLAELARFAQAGAAPRTWATWRLQHDAPAEKDPLRITQSPFWRKRHASFEESFKSAGFPKAHACDACHADATSGMFSPRMIHIPEQETGQ